VAAAMAVQVWVAATMSTELLEMVTKWWTAMVRQSSDVFFFTLMKL
jgi:hypothetical protein